jgi:hypothetical protein
MFFSGDRLPKHFLVDLGIGEDGKDGKSDLDQVVQQQARDYQKVRQQIEDYMQVIEEAEKTDKRTGWLPILKGRHLAHLGHIARLPDHSELELQTATDLSEKSIAESVKCFSNAFARNPAIAL